MPTNVNHAFGEGASVKLRSIRHGVDGLFESGHRAITDEITKHSMPRLVYGAMIAENGHDFLTGRATVPKYPFAFEDPKAETRRISDYWVERWLSVRLNHRESLDRLAAFDKNKLRLSQELTTEEALTFMPIESPQPIPEQNHGWLDFIRELHRGTSAYADRTDKALLEIVARAFVPYTGFGSLAHPRRPRFGWAP